MTRHRHRRTQKAIARLFEGGRLRQETATLFNTLRRCPACAARYEQYRETEAALSTVCGAPDRLAVARLADAVIGSVHPGADKPRVRALKWALVPVSALAAAALLFLMWPASPMPHRVPIRRTPETTFRELLPRSASTPGPAHVGIRVFVVSAKTRPLREASAVSIDDVITFTYTHTKEERGCLMIFGLQEHVDTPLWYYPDYEEDTSLSIPGDRVDTPLGDGIVLSVNHLAGEVRIVSLFSDTPLDKAAVASAITRLRQENELLDISVPVPLDAFGVNAIEHSVVLTIEDINNEKK